MAGKRRNISPDVMLRLWAVAGARCEFASCNVPLWRERLTLKEANFSEKAHVRAVRPTGARYDPVLSDELQTDIGNLMLLCSVHHHLIDDKKLRAEFPPEKLLKMKKDHEERIFRVTELGPQHRTNVIVFAATIGDRRPEILINRVHEAALESRYPTDKGIKIDLTNLMEPNSPDEWQQLAKNISEQLNREMRPGNDADRVAHHSVFALAPMPLLMHLGKTIGNTSDFDVYQLHRDGRGWTWAPDRDTDPEAYVHEWPETGTASDVALILSVSGRPTRGEVTGALASTMPIYEIRVPNPSRVFLDTRQRLVGFKDVYRRTLAEIRTRHGGNVKIHLFPAVPIAIAIACGQELLPKIDPAMTVYDANAARGGWVKTLQI